MEPRKEQAETLELQDTGLLVDRVLNVSHMDARTGAFINLMGMW